MPISLAMRRLMFIFLLVLAARGSAAGPRTDVVLLGQSAAFTGPTQALGLEIRKGIEAYLTHLNLSGGIEGRPVLLKSFDDMGSAVTSVENARKLVDEEKVVALIGTVGTPASEAVAAYANTAKVPLIAPFSGAESLRRPANRYVFNLRAGHSREAERLARQLSAMGLSSASVAFQDDAFGRECLVSFEAAATQAGLKVKTSRKLSSARSEVQAAAQAIVASGPQAVVLFATYDIGADFIRAARTAGYGAVFMTVSAVGSKALSDELLEQARGIGMTQVVPFPWVASVPLVAEYQRLMLASGHSQKDFGFSSLEGFMAAKLTVDALRRTGRDMSSQRLADSLEGLGDVDLGGFFVRYGPQSKDGSKYVDLTVIGPAGRFLK